MKKILKILFNRVFYISVSLLLQAAWWLALVWFLSNTSQAASVLTRVITVIVVLWLVNKKINPSYKLAWTILILVVPIFGICLYALFGTSRIAAAMQRNYKEVLEKGKILLKESPDTRRRLDEMNQSASNQSRYIRDYAEFPLQEGTVTEYFSEGEYMFPRLLEELKKAQHYIFMEYFIINDGIMWNSILEVLEEKAGQGVDVRLIYDDFGCITTLPHRFYKSLQSQGIKCAAFNPFRPMLNVILNNRDHRKICIVDGHTGFTGGINLADEYINRRERFGHWKDTGIMLKGEAVWNLTVMFLQMWSVITKMQVRFSDYIPHRYHEEEFESDGFVHPYCDTPLDNEVVGEDVYLNMINRAEKYVYICTPYLIIDNEMMTALCLAAKSGVDVRIMTPGIPDKKIVFLLTQSYYEQLIESGVKIYEYRPGFLHAKSFVCDDELAVIGSINMDYRSLYLHFENAVWLYKSRIVKDMYQDYLETQELCRQITLDFCRNRNVVVRAVQSVLRLFAPML
ncbi:MAG: cardiolipin synthase [Lachnospiraceae bacterium]|jgi:cardiolipin synthase|nr:cardiolipin synthase [Lachnospiraceae bacterium]MCI9098568.1 cardiolipin synthase [Lachnospiraceae bacterium]